ncbi:MAG: translesion error-prone DNA polymerase V autoproteolytic subunit [Verrucomicrobia bacterium]|nr:translesion error-prone DNA polymerase V autoproteolytic subunit [Verrucomicrobiota bacterium]
MEKTIYHPKITPCPLPFFEGGVKAGFPSPADDYGEMRLDLNEHLIQHPAATFYVKVDGDSMTGAGIHRGDILIVDRSLEAVSGKIVIAVVNGEFTVKRVRKAGREIWLEAENPNFPPMKIDPAWDFQIWGVVTYVIHKTG